MSTVFFLVLLHTAYLDLISLAWSLLKSHLTTRAFVFESRYQESQPWEMRLHNHYQVHSPLPLRVLAVGIPT